jgi:succinoglycan biosynthesis protein ExoA
VIDPMDKPAGNVPFVSVIMPVRNEASSIATSLESVLAQDYPADRFEVLVIDGMSSDGTVDVVRKLTAQPQHLSVHLNPAGIAPAAMNIGIRHARGSVIVRVDGHTRIACDYIRTCVEQLARTGADNVGGRMDAVSEGTFGKAVAAATSSRFGVGNSTFHYATDQQWVDTVYLGAWPRSLFDRVGPFDEEMVRNQDDELNYRIIRNGGKILFSPDIRSTYQNRATVPGLWKQYFQYGYWKVRVMQKHPAQMRFRQLIPPVFVLAVVLALLLVPLGGFLRWPFVCIGGVYLLANLAASAISAPRAGGKAALLLPLAFFTLHVAYGSGFLTGLVRFSGSWGRTTNHTGMLA